MAQMVFWNIHALGIQSIEVAALSSWELEVQNSQRVSVVSLKSEASFLEQLTAR